MYYVLRCPECGLLVEVDFTSTNLKCPKCLGRLELWGIYASTSYTCTNLGYWTIVEDHPNLMVSIWHLG